MLSFTTVELKQKGSVQCHITLQLYESAVKFCSSSKAEAEILPLDQTEMKVLHEIPIKGEGDQRLITQKHVKILQHCFPSVAINNLKIKVLQ